MTGVVVGVAVFVGVGVGDGHIVAPVISPTEFVE